MNKIICQLWKRCNTDGRNVIERYSLHLNEKQRLIFLNKNLPRLSGSNDDLSVQHYFCEVDNNVYDKVMKKQIKHGLMVEGDSPPADIRYKGCSKKNYVEWKFLPYPTAEKIPVARSMTVQFSDLKKMLINDMWFPPVDNPSEEIVTDYDFEEDEEEEEDEDEYFNYS